MKIIRVLTSQPQQDIPRVMAISKKWAWKFYHPQLHKNLFIVFIVLIQDFPTV